MKPKEGDRVKDRVTGVSFRVTLVGDRMIGLEAEGQPIKTVITVGDLRKGFSRVEESGEAAKGSTYLSR